MADNPRYYLDLAAQRIGAASVVARERDRVALAYGPIAQAAATLAVAEQLARLADLAEIAATPPSWTVAPDGTVR